jgi:hypothetical protein
MTTWNADGTGKWISGSEQQHVLLQAGGRLIELHGGTVHAYTAADKVDPASPLTGATHLGTWAQADLADAAPAAAYKALAAKDTPWLHPSLTDA